VMGHQREIQDVIHGEWNWDLRTDQPRAMISLVSDFP
jgi:hypothetical protein